MEAIFNAIINFAASDFGKLVGKIIKVFGILGTPYWIISFFFTRKFKPAKKQHKYAICIAARNEETVIGNLLDSIARQDYPSELLTVFVVADNCTDSTASVARSKGAICYERFNDRDKTKGFALQYLFDNIKRDYGIETFEGYFIFDADNLLKQDYITRMNESYDAGLKIITSYRNTKNFDENWIASTYALHWLRSIRKNHRARSVLRLATNIQGTGFLFDNIFVRDGWKYTSLTEDRAFTADAVAQGYEISYNDAAMFYDEQPTSLRIALRQRLRWSKGHLLAFRDTGWALFKNIILGNHSKVSAPRKETKGARFIESIRHRVASFDTLAQLIPSAIITTAFWILGTFTISSILRFFNGYTTSLFYATGSNYLSRLLYAIFGPVSLSFAPGVKALLASLALAIFFRVFSRIWQYIKKIPMAAYVFIMERKRIIKIPLHKKILFCFTWPVFDIIHRYTSYVALFMKVTWKPIPHTRKVTITDVEK